MKKIEIKSPIQKITSGNEPTPLTLPDGAIAVGKVSGKGKIFANVDDEILDLNPTHFSVVETTSLNINMSDCVDYVANLATDEILDISGENPYWMECYCLIQNKSEIRSINITIPDEYIFFSENRVVQVNMHAELSVKKYLDKYVVTIIAH